MDSYQKSEMMATIEKLINARHFDGRAVFLFGFCNATVLMADYLILKKITPAAILDNNSTKQGGVYHDIKILSPESILAYNASDSVVLVASRFFAQMREQLKKMGYKGEILKVVEYDSFTEYSLSEDTIKRKTERMNRGAATLRKIRTEHGTEHMAICPSSSLGDVYWAMSFLTAYMSKHKIKNMVVVVVGKSCHQVAQMFGKNKIIILETMREMDELVSGIIYTREKNCIIAHHDRPYTDNIIKWLDKHFLSFADYYRCAVYGISKDTKAEKPSHFIQFENKYDIPEGNSVIISPYAKSVVGLPAEFWENIVDDYLTKGFAVYTNVVEDERPIKGTTPINIPISQMHTAVCYAGTFIGLRSGLCDIIHTSKCRKIVIFPDVYYSTTPHKVADFFALEGWETIIYS